ncbi:MAG TPA: PAS domain S-box protein, partial [Desulfosarcina sp.]|nr:PAS domain S-box protein [Desulfosarcina sp.]
EAYCRITGYTEAELLGEGVTFQQLNHPDDLEDTLAELRRMTAGAIPAFFVEKRYRRKDGSITWVRTSASLRRSADGGAPQIVGLVEDIDERKRTEKALAVSEKQYRELVETANSIILRWDRDGVIRFINDYGLRYFGYRKSELVGKTIMTIVPPVEQSTGRDLDALARDLVQHPELYASVPCENLRRDGSTVWVTWANKAILNEDGGVKEILAIGNDITELKEAEAALRRSNDELEQFAYVASHDLQEPLRSVVGFLQLLQHRFADQLDDKGRHYIERSVAAGHRMQTLIRDLLTLSRVHTKGAAFAPTSLELVLDNVLDHLAPFLQDNHAEVVRRGVLPVLSVDEAQIESIFQNLIMNAVKYNESTRPRIAIGVHESDDAYRFSVKDNGIGIAARFHARIFMVFQRLHTEREYPGTGLGLALCQKIVERHGGTIWVESQPQEGATFNFTLPKTRWKG